ncbi:rRNA methyltransferase Rrp8 [Schizosaccharomyces japonicus yFS275]|uniref:Ribosomal RNA-processing protein 8 n=1 Tax=Schizosaccharomyces japonicus (strain yFS275 / FY16936) TaxID=402676 RepID=B6K4Z8_SCHJY|nr:rRNA methyltransferase Rrp8 [Schizosaccharomyces japonicus yFS275]EEB08555.1 rRNA methyltransferase Rrp8 [Schizosaccharomyces japonicus yFS275]
MFNVSWDIKTASPATSKKQGKNNASKKRPQKRKRSNNSEEKSTNTAQEKSLGKKKSNGRKPDEKKPGKNDADVKLAKSTKTAPPKRPKLTSLQQKMKEKLDGAAFRWINEKLYTTDSADAVKLFSEHPEMFHTYHTGFRHQVESWPENPVDIFIGFIKEQFFEDKKRDVYIADLGCGDAKIALECASMKHIHVSSFDLVAHNERVTAADIAHLPLEAGTMDVAIFCLSLMGTNLDTFLREAHRVLKPDGELWVAEIKSRFTDKRGKVFGEELTKVGFELEHMYEENKMFTLFQFRRVEQGETDTLPVLLNPCIYKRR